MKKEKLIALLCITGASFLLSFSPHPVANKVEIAIIINAGNPVNKLSADFVKNFWLRRFIKRWKETNKGILPVDHKTKSAEQDLFYKSVLGLPPDAVESYLSARQYQSGDNPPQKFASDADVINYVGNEIGAIGYVSAASVTENDKNVKVILTVTK
jgi:ABC-type phosphate transport system substrate-binding protein